eukprot:TRINITY_DN2439_c0_g3_i1.p1 TRINITY_DN2439_c0_g3~~TRINITY_DN2439_c0_g3_i1.p1  ORF type:complete len:221 (+),score=10.07 TRINITY_DN2439_c0_g3_i1:39-665(+)
MAFTCIVITVNLRLLMACTHLTKWHHLSVIGSSLSWLLFIFIYGGVRTSYDKQDNIYWVIFLLMGTWYFWFTIILVPIVALSGDFLYQGLQRWFFPYDYQIIQEDAKYHTVPNILDSERRLELVSMLGPAPSVEEERTYSMAQLPGQMSRKHTGFSFDSPGFESFFAMQEGVPTPHRSWDVARRASMHTPRRNTDESQLASDRHAYRR